MHHTIVVSILWCFYRENDRQKGNIGDKFLGLLRKWSSKKQVWGDKFLGFLEKTSLKVAKNILSIYQKAYL